MLVRQVGSVSGGKSGKCAKNGVHLTAAKTRAFEDERTIV
jgi:hypothetical protein